MISFHTVGSFVHSVQLEKERQQREDAEKEKRELEERLKKYEDEFEKAKLGQFLSCLPFSMS